MVSTRSQSEFQNMYIYFAIRSNKQGWEWSRTVSAEMVGVQGQGPGGG